MLITVTLPWFRAHADGRKQEVYLVKEETSELDGSVCVDGLAVSLTGGEPVRLPAYIATKDIPGFIQNQLGVEYGKETGAKLN